MYILIACYAALRRGLRIALTRVRLVPTYNRLRSRVRHAAQPSKRVREACEGGPREAIVVEYAGALYSQSSCLDLQAVYALLTGGCGFGAI